MNILFEVIIQKVYGTHFPMCNILTAVAPHLAHKLRPLSDMLAISHSILGQETNPPPSPYSTADHIKV